MKCRNKNLIFLDYENAISYPADDMTLLFIKIFDMIRNTLKVTRTLQTEIFITIRNII